MSNDDQPFALHQVARPEGRGCAGTLAGINLLFMGLLTRTFAVGPYSSAAQMTWYRGGSIAFLSLGAILPIAALLAIARRHRGIGTALTLWMCVALLAFLSYVFMSGGGV